MRTTPGGLLDRKAQTAQDETGSEQQRCGGGGCARTAAFHPRASEGGAEAEEYQGCAERSVGRTEPACRIGERGRDSRVEDAPRVDGADADVDGDGSERDKPAAERSGGTGWSGLGLR